jgi:uncharacterized LabA/DUF88 family protein
MVDGGFFHRRYKRLFEYQDPATCAKQMHGMCLDHLKAKSSQERNQLYRILFYDCPPMDKKVHLPISGKSLDYSKTATYKFRTEFHEELKKLRSVAIRLGELRDGEKWVVQGGVMKEPLRGDRAFQDLTDDDFSYDLRQKGVDMKIGLDIASLSYKKLVDQIVLVAGDSDFVPAAKLARREGIDVILDPMWQPVSDDLFEHIDGLRSTLARPKRRGGADLNTD